MLHKGLYLQKDNVLPPFSEAPVRIVSTVPSQTELLFDLGLEESVVGITKFCIHPPEWFRTKTRVGGTKNLQIEKIRSLAPDLVLANMEENTKQDIESLASFSTVWVSDIVNLEDAKQMISTIGSICHRNTQAENLCFKIDTDLDHYIRWQTEHDMKKHKAAYLIWKEPLITVGADTFIHHMMEYCGFINIFADTNRYPQISMELLKKRLERTGETNFLLLSSEPFPFREREVNYFRQYLPQTNIMLVDGEMFSWYGSRLLKSLDYFKKLLSA
jgi:ABC-type Fe3+-hydroxamate transport system substrate-binding protein